MRKTLLTLLFLFCGAGYAEAQGTLYQLSPPAPNAQVRVCPSPDNGYPCPTTAAIFSDVGLTQSLAQPVSLGSGGFFSFYIASGTYVIQLSGPGYGSGNRQTVTIGGSSSGASGNAIAPPQGLYIAQNCPTSSNSCFQTPANTQENNFATFTNTSAAVTAQTQSAFKQVSATVAANVATYTLPTPLQYGWAAGDTVTIANFTGADTFFSVGPVTITATTANSISVALVHANASSTTFGTITNSTKGPFVAGDVGKRIFGYSSCFGSGGLSTISPMTTAVLTIQTFNTSASITASGTATGSSGANTGCIIWGNPDDAAAVLMDAAAQVSPSCQTEHLVSGNYLYTVPHHFQQPYACSVSPALNGGASTAAGNLLYAAGLNVEGRNNGSTNIYLPPGFPETGPGCVNGNSGLGCFVVTTEGKLSNIHITGGGNFSSANFGSGKILMEVDGPATLENFTCTNFGLSPGGTIGIGAFLWSQLNFINNSGCGDAGIATSNGSGDVTCIRCSVDNPRTFGYLIGQLTAYFTQNPLQFDKYNFNCYDCFAFNQNSGAAAGNLMRVINSQSVKGYHFRFSPYAALTAPNGEVGVFLNAGNFDCDDCFLDMSAAGTVTATGNIGISTTGGGGNIFLKNTIIKGSTGGSAYSGTAADIFNDQGGNTIGTTNILGTLIADGHSVKGICTGVATASSTLALNISGVSLTGTGLVSACTGATLDKGVAVNGARVLQNLICTSSATTVSVACTVMISHNGGAFGATTLTCTMTAAVRCTDGTHQPAVADGDLVTIQIVTGAAETGANIKAIAEWN